MIPRSSGNTTRSSSPSKRRSRISKATWRSVRSSIRTKSGSKPTSSSPFLAYCMQITLTRRLHALAPGLTARSALEKFAAVQMIDVHLPTTDGREILLTRYTHPEPELQLLIDQPQAPPATAAAAQDHHRRRQPSQPP